MSFPSSPLLLISLSFKYLHKTPHLSSLKYVRPYILLVGVNLHDQCAYAYWYQLNVLHFMLSLAWVTDPFSMAFQSLILHQFIQNTWLLKSFTSPATSLIHLFTSLSNSSFSSSLLMPCAIPALSISIHVSSCSQTHSSLLLPCPLSFLKNPLSSHATNALSYLWKSISSTKILSTFL